MEVDGMRQNPNSVGQEPLRERVQRPLTGEDPRSVKVQAITAAGFALASYLLFFVFTSGSADVAAEQGNIIAEYIKNYPPAKTVSKSPKLEEPKGIPSSGANIVSRVIQGASEGRRQSRLVKLTKRDYEDFFGILEQADRQIEKHVVSRSGSKAACEMRYRAFEAVVKRILGKHSNVFARDRSLAQKWQDVKKATAGIYRISYHPNTVMVRTTDSGNWYSPLARLAFRDGEPPGFRPYVNHTQAIATARERLFDQRLTVGEYEAVLAASKFAKSVHAATKNAHEAMETFYDALVSIARTDSFVRHAIRNKRIGFDSFSLEDELLESFQTEYGMQELFDKGYGLGLMNEGTAYGKFANVLCNPPYLTSVESVDETDRENMKRNSIRASWSTQRITPRHQRKP